MNYNKEREISKKMISTMKKLRINEASEPSDTMRPFDEDYNAEISQFKSQITSQVDFTTFNIYPKTSSALFGGEFKDFQGFEWQFSIPGNDGLYITTNNLQVTDEVVTRIQKLKAYYDDWAKRWADKIDSDYKNNNTRF